MRKASRLGFGARLRELRESLEVTQAELADAAHMDQSLLSKYEREDVSPSWLQIERLLEALGQSPCALFPDDCASAMGLDEQFFDVSFYSGKPKDVLGSDTPTAVLKVHREAPFVKVYRLPPVSGRFYVARSEDDAMIPDWYPGDYLIIDSKLEPRAGRVIAGFFAGEPMARRLVRQGSKMILVSSNRHYPPLQWNEAKWHHGGTIVYVMRDMTTRYTGMEEE